MPFTVKRLACFERQVKRVLKKHSNSTKHVNDVITGLADKPNQGDVYPGFNPVSVRKMRIGLPEYRIGKRGGLRLVFLTVPIKKKIIPLAIYRKKLFSSEQDVRMRIQESLKAITDELSNKHE